MTNIDESRIVVHIYILFRNMEVNIRRTNSKT